MEKKIIEYFESQPKGLKLSVGEVYYRVRHPNGRRATANLLCKMVKKGLLKRETTWKGLPIFAKA